MKVLAVSNLFPSSLEPTRATFNRQHFEHLSQQLDLSLLVPLAWPGRIRGGKPSRVDAVQGDVEFATFFYTPKLLPSLHGSFCRWSIGGLFERMRKHQQPDLIYATWVYPDGLAAARLAKRHGLPVVIKAHGSDLHSIGSGRNQATQTALNLANQVITVSSSQCELATQCGVDRKKITTIYNGIDALQFAIQDRADCRNQLQLSVTAPLVVFVGNLKPVKGLILLLRGFAAMERRDAQLAIVGDGALKSQLLALAAELGVSQRIRFVGPVPHAQVPLWINAADAVVLTSRNEGVPNVLLEAKACGVPVVATRVGGVAEVVEHRKDGFLLEGRDVEELGRGLDWTLDQPWCRKQLSERSKQFSWAQNVRQTKAVFDNALLDDE